MVKKDCPCCGTKGTPRKFKSLSQDRFIWLNNRRAAVGLEPLQEGVKLRKSCYYDVLKGVVKKTRRADSSTSDSEGEPDNDRVKVPVGFAGGGERPIRHLER
jgi:hypothetical protein